MVGFGFKNKALGSSGSSFFMQYLSLILIILVFTIGAFLRGKTITEKEVRKEEFVQLDSEQKQEKIVKTDLSSIEYNDLFVSKDTTINTVIAEALILFLKNHDVESEIIFSPDSESEADYNLALGRALVFATYLENQEIPRDSWRVITSDLPRRNQAIVKLVGVKEKNELL